MATHELIDRNMWNGYLICQRLMLAATALCSGRGWEGVNWEGVIDNMELVAPDGRPLCLRDGEILRLARQYKDGGLPALLPPGEKITDWKLQTIGTLQRRIKSATGTR